MNINPLTRMDYPDPDVIRVGDTYYMVSTTMYFFPGCEILRSFDLVHWEHASYVYERLDSTDAQRLVGRENAYGQGMWAASLRFHNGKFYVVFVANDTHKTYLYTAEDIAGPWSKSEIRGFYHDNSLLFDDDKRVYIVYGNKEVYITELNADLSGPKEGGLSRLIIRDSDDAYLGYEGSHIYKIDGRYYIFLIHIPKGTGRRTESCFVADSLESKFRGCDVFDDDYKIPGSGIAQGGIVQTPSGKWYAILFQDSGAVGRIPFLLPVKFEYSEEFGCNFPTFGAAKNDTSIYTDADTYSGGDADTSAETSTDADREVVDNSDSHTGEGIASDPDTGRSSSPGAYLPKEIEIEDLKPGYQYAKLYGSDDFKSGHIETGASSDVQSDHGYLDMPVENVVVKEHGHGRMLMKEVAGCKDFARHDSFGFRSFWQFNHEPSLEFVEHDVNEGSFKIITGKLSTNLVQAQNTLTQRTLFPKCAAEVTLDGAELNDGDYAGLCLLQSSYAFIGLTRRAGELFITMCSRTITVPGIWGERNDNESPKEIAAIPLQSVTNSSTIRLRAEVDFTDLKDEVSFSCAAEERSIDSHISFDRFTSLDRHGSYDSSTSSDGHGSYDRSTSSDEHGSYDRSTSSDGHGSFDRSTFPDKLSLLGEPSTLVSNISDVEDTFTPLGTPHKLIFKLDHFTGARFGLFAYSTLTTGGAAKFMDFRYFGD